MHKLLHSQRASWWLGCSDACAQKEMLGRTASTLQGHMSTHSSQQCLTLLRPQEVSEILEFACVPANLVFW